MAGDSENRYDDWKAYEYNPSAAAAAIFMVLFLSSAFLHTYQITRTRTWFFIPLVIGAFFEGIGYIGRLVSSTESPDWSVGPYAMQSTLLLVAPALFAASIYMELGRLITLADGEKLSLIRVSWLTKLFVGGDVLSFLMQSSGAGLLVQGNPDTGEKIVIGGLFLQIIYFGLFVISAGIFHARIRKHATAQFLQLRRTWLKHMYALYGTSLLILVRSIVRVVEYLQGMDGYLLAHEAFIYVFDAALMFIVLLIFHFAHPSEVNCLLGRTDKMSKKGGLRVDELSIPLHHQQR